MTNLLTLLGCVAYSQGEYTTAGTLHEESLAISRELENKWAIAISLNNLGLVAYSQGDYARARTRYLESLAILPELGHTRELAACLSGLGGVAVEMGFPARGAKLLGAAEALLEAIGAALDVDDRAVFEQGSAAARAQLGDEEFKEAWQEGRGMSVEETIAYALAE
jgi:tetratricopeptide (TPR) repeat protein